MSDDKTQTGEATGENTGTGDGTPARVDSKGRDISHLHQGRPETFYNIADDSKRPGFRTGTRTADMRQCIIDNPEGVTSAMLAEASGAPRSHCSDYLWRCMQRGWIGHRPEPETPDNTTTGDAGDATAE